jgi:tetratricopeptide (TPR) repeat protein
MMETQGKYVDAANKYLEILQTDPINLTAKSRLTQLKPKVEEYVKGEYRRGLRFLTGDEPRNLVIAGNIFANIVSIDPEHMEARKRLSIVRVRINNFIAGKQREAEKAISNGRYQIAIDEFDAILSIKPDDRQALAGKEDALRSIEISKLLKQAKSYFDNDDYFAALREYQKILNLAPYDLGAQTGFEKTQSKLHELAERAFNDGIESYAKDRYEEAIKHWNDALAYNPGHQGAAEYKQQAMERIQALKKLQN